MANKRKKTKFGDDADDVVTLSSVIYVGRTHTRPQALIQDTHISVNSPCPSIQGPLRPAENVIRTSRVVRPSPSKKPHVERRQGPDVDLVPSSQSDEQVLAVPRSEKKHLDEVKESVNKWRTGAVATTGPAPMANDWEMDLGEDFGVVRDDNDNVMSPIETSTSEIEIFTNLLPTSPHTTRHSSPSEPVQFVANGTSIERISAHCPSRSLTPTPPPLSPQSKTAQIIAQIKADAYQATRSSPDSDDREVVFREDLDDDSSEDDLFCGRGYASVIPFLLIPLWMLRDQV
jgi:hypothetical protein